MNSRTEMILGREAVQRLHASRVIIFGVGGVGSWCAEALVRSGVGHVTIVDFDTVATSNINRQLMATSSSVGRKKVEVLAERLLDINPALDLTAIADVYNEETASNYDFNSYDYIIDAIDSLKDKALLILRATASRATLFSSMGAALKLHPQKVSVAEFWKVQGCPLARALRTRFRREKEFPSKKFHCVYSDELVDSEGKGSLVHITGIFGFTLAGLLIEDVSKTVDN